MTIATPELPKWVGALAGTLSADGPEVQIRRVRPLAGGACQDNFRVDLERAGEPGAWVLRSDARSSLPGSLRRAEEHEVIALAVAGGVPTPPSRGPLRDLIRPGADALLIEWRPGVAIGARVLRDPELEQARERLPDQLADALAAIHRIRAADHPTLPVRHLPQCATPERDAVTAALRFQREMLDQLPDAHPGLELALRWLEDHRPPEREPRLVHGDFRVGNFLVDPSGLTAVLDWEFAHWGTPAEDLAWLCVRDWRFGRLDRAAGGLATRERFYDAYARASGAPVDPAEVHWWEVLGNVRWAGGACWQAERVLAGHERDLELLAIGRRAAEMEFEALRLIAQGPPR